MASNHALGVVIAVLAVLVLWSCHIDAASEPSNVNHCGDHHVVCPSRPNSQRTCTDGQCGIECKSGYILYNNNACVLIQSPLPPCASSPPPPPPAPVVLPAPIPPGAFQSPPPPPFSASPPPPPSPASPPPPPCNPVP